MANAGIIFHLRNTTIAREIFNFHFSFAKFENAH
jgi:hypothetical protein